MEGGDSESSNRKSTLGISVLFEMNNDLVIDKVDKMYSKLGPFKIPGVKNKGTHQEYIILEGGFYTGFTKENVPEGCGSLLLNTGQVYEGCFKMGQIQGKGRMIDLDGTAYEGNWKKNDIRGEGKIMWLDGKVYEGKIRKIKPHGFGTLVFPDTSCYKGRFIKGCMHGNGVITWANSKVYAGEWRRSEMNGFGTMHWSNKYFFGSFKSGEIHGIGKMEWKNGRVYLGEWEKGYRHGIGCMMEYEKILEGQWENDEFMNSESFQGMRMDKMTEQLEEKLKELKNDENLERFLQFSVFVFKAQEFVSELQGESVVESEIEEFGTVNESFWSIEHLKKPKTLMNEVRRDEDGEDFRDQSSISKSQSRIEVNMPELHLSESFSNESQPKQEIGHSKSNSIEEVNEPELVIDESYSIPLSMDQNKVENSHVDASIPSEYTELPIFQPVLHKPELDSIDSVKFEIPSSSGRSSSKYKSRSKAKVDFKDNSAELDVQSESRSEKYQDFIHKPFIEIPESINNTVRDSDEYSLPQLKMIKEFTLDPSFSSAPLLIHAPQVVIPEFEEVSISLEQIEEVNESLHELLANNSIQTIFNEESEIEIEVEEFKLPVGIDMNYHVKAKEKPNKKNITGTVGRLEKVLVVKHDPTGKAVPMKTSIIQSRPDGNLDNFESKDRQLLVVLGIKDEIESVEIELQEISLPLDPEKFEILYEIREMLLPFDYFDTDQERYSKQLFFIDWQEDNDLVYSGQIDLSGNREGMGIEITPTGVYEGYWKANKRHGLGRLITIDGDNFEGFWRFDYKRGFGTLWKFIGEGYIGDWDFDTPEGLGTEISSLEIFEGNFHYGLRHGKGVLTQTNLVYTGEFFEGNIHGYGVVQWNNGSTYAGIFINGESKGLKGAFIPAYKRTEYKPRGIKKTSSKPLNQIIETGSSDNEKEHSLELFDSSGKKKAFKLEVTKKIESDSDKNEDLDNEFKDNEEKNHEFSVSSKISEKKNKEILNSSKLSDNKNSEALNNSNASDIKKPFPGGFLSILSRPNINKSPSFHSMENSRIEESFIIDKDFYFHEATKGIVKSSSPKKETNRSPLEGLKFSGDVKDYDDEELQRRKAKFKSANKEKDVKNILKKDKKKP